MKCWEISISVIVIVIVLIILIIKVLRVVIDSLIGVEIFSI